MDPEQSTVEFRILRMERDLTSIRLTHFITLCRSDSLFVYSTAFIKVTLLRYVLFCWNWSNYQESSHSLTSGAGRSQTSSFALNITAYQFDVHGSAQEWRDGHVENNLFKRVFSRMILTTILGAFAMGLGRRNVWSDLDKGRDYLWI